MGITLNLHSHNSNVAVAHQISQEAAVIESVQSLESGAGARVMA